MNNGDENFNSKLTGNFILLANDRYKENTRECSGTQMRNAEMRRSCRIGQWSNMEHNEEYAN